MTYKCPDCGLSIGMGSTSCIRCKCPIKNIVNGVKSTPKEIEERKKPKILQKITGVSSPKYDDIGKILDGLNIKFKSFNELQYKCDILFLNCGTQDKIDTIKLRKFVEDGGCLYASDLMDTTLNKTFPNIFDFAGHIGNKMKMNAEVVDKELVELIKGVVPNNMVEIEFDLGSWAVLNKSQGDVLLKSSSSKFVGKPLMVKVKYGKGMIFFTSFHNIAAISESQRNLLKLLILSLYASYLGQTVNDVSLLTGNDLSRIINQL